MGAALERAADELYGLPLDGFVPRRDELARELRAAGERDDADAVRRLVKPSAPAWVVNRLARERPDEVRELFEAGSELRRVQEWLLRREADPADLRAAVEDERAAVGRLVRAGVDVLAAAGRPARGDILARIGDTLHAATVDPAVRADVERGRLVRDRAAVGAGGPGSSMRPAAAAAASASPPRAGAGGPRADAAEQRRRQASAAAQGELRQAEAESKAADRMRAAAERAAERFHRELEAAEAAYEQAREGLRAAREELAAAQKAADAARDAADGAAAEVDRRQQTVDDL